MTNYERIKAMSVKEMAEMLLDESDHHYIYCAYCPYHRLYARHCASNDIEVDCRKAVIKWLNGRNRKRWEGYNNGEKD